MLRLASALGNGFSRDVLAWASEDRKGRMFHSRNNSNPAAGCNVPVLLL